MQAIRWLYDQAIAADPMAWRVGGAAWCYLCAAPCPNTTPSQPVKTAMRDTFTNHDLARCRASAWVCPACAWYLDNGQQFRTFSWRITPSEAAAWDRATMRTDLDALLDGYQDYSEPLVLAISVSHKKHVVLRAIPAYSNDPLTVQFEEQSVAIHPAPWRSVTHIFDTLRKLGHSKSEITSGQLHPMSLKRHGQIARALTLLALLNPYRGGQLLDVVSYVSPGGDQTERTIDDGHGVTGNGGGIGALPVGRDTERLQEQIPPRDLGTGAKPRGRARKDDGDSGGVAQSRLFDV